MSTSNEMPIMRRGGDLFFNHVFGEKLLMVQVTHECLADVFGSNGAPEQDLKALKDNLPAILKIVAGKALRGETSHIVLTVADF